MTTDIRERAERLQREMLHNATGLTERDLLSQALLEAHNAGRDEMREEAAKVADVCLFDIHDSPHDFGALDLGGIRASEKIATAIRSIK